MIPVIIIGGIPGVGKTSISGYLAREFNINIILSGDYLREFLRPYNDSILNKSVYEAYKFYGEKTEKNIINGYLDQTKIIYKGINAILNRSIKNGEQLILETLYFLPELIDKNIFNKIIPIYIDISDINIHKNRLKSRINYTHFNSPGERLINQLDVYKVISNYSIENSKNKNVLLVDNINYDETKEKIKNYIKSKLEL